MTEQTFGILLVEDHEMTRRELRQLLEAHPKWTVLGEAQNGKEALDLIHEQAPDIVVMDVQMPVMNGLETLREIAQRHPDTDVIMISNYTEPVLIDSALEAGAKGYVSKQSAYEDLVPSIEAVAEGRM